MLLGFQQNFHPSRPPIQSRLIRAMEFLSYQRWLRPAALTLATILAVRTALRIRGRVAVEHTSRRPQELKVLYEPDDGATSSARKSDRAVECVSISQSFADNYEVVTDTNPSIEASLPFTVSGLMLNVHGCIGEPDVAGCASSSQATWVSAHAL